MKRAASERRREYNEEQRDEYENYLEEDRDGKTTSQTPAHAFRKPNTLTTWLNKQRIKKQLNSFSSDLERMIPPDHRTPHAFKASICGPLKADNHPQSGQKAVIWLQSQFLN